MNDKPNLNAFEIHRDWYTDLVKGWNDEKLYENYHMGRASLLAFEAQLEVIRATDTTPASKQVSEARQMVETHRLQVEVMKQVMDARNMPEVRLIGDEPENEIDRKARHIARNFGDLKMYARALSEMTDIELQREHKETLREKINATEERKHLLQGEASTDKVKAADIRFALASDNCLAVLQEYSRRYDQIIEVEKNQSPVDAETMAQIAKLQQIKNTVGFVMKARDVIELLQVVRSAALALAGELPTEGRYNVIKREYHPIQQHANRASYELVRAWHETNELIARFKGVCDEIVHIHRELVPDAHEQFEDDYWAEDENEYDDRDFDDIYDDFDSEMYRGDDIPF